MAKQEICGKCGNTGWTQTDCKGCKSTGWVRGGTEQHAVCRGRGVLNHKCNH